MLKLLGNLHKRERLLTVVCLLLALGRCWLDLLLPGYMRDLTLLAQTPGSAPAMGWVIGRKMVICGLSSLLLAVPSSWCAAQSAAGFAYALRETLFGKGIELGKAEVNAFSVSGLVTCTTDDVNRLQQILNEGLQVLVRLPVTVILVVARMPGRSWLSADLMELGGYGFYVVLSLLEAAAVLRQLPAVRSAAERILSVLDAEPSVQPGTRSAGRGTGSLEFRSVSFAYPGETHRVLENISFRIEKGQTVAVVGAPGCGKSALADLAARLYDPAEGQIILDGLDLREYTFEALYNRLGYVPQKARVFSGSVRSNLFFGEREASDREPELKAVLEGIPGEGLPDRVEHGGETLSNGQRQRLAIGRVLARKPEVLILDDCLSGLDHQACGKLLEGLQNTAVLLITGQRDLAQMADQILVLEQGRLVSAGQEVEQ